MKHTFVLLFISISLIVVSGCAEGMFWKTGRYSPWARDRWAEEERIADTLFTKKKRMEETVQAAKGGGFDEKQRAGEMLGQTASRDSVLLMRLHAVQLLGELDCPAAQDALENASRDYNSDVRIAAIDAWQRKTPDLAIPQLQELVANDTHIDVRLAATRALGNFSGGSAMRALEIALNDPDPALQLRAAESLRASTGQPFGHDVVAWQHYVEQQKGSAGLESQPVRSALKLPSINSAFNR